MVVYNCVAIFISGYLISHTQMKLIPHDSEHCLFRILPRYKVRSVGDEVAYSCASLAC